MVRPVLVVLITNKGGRNMLPVRVSGFVAFVVSCAAVAGCSGGSDGTDADSASHDVIVDRSDDRLEAELEKAVDGLLFGSDSEAPFTVLRARAAAGDPITAETVKARFTGLSVTKEGTTSLKNIRGTDQEPFAKWFDDRLSLPRGPSADSERFDAGLRRARTLMEANLTDRTVFFVGEAVQPGFHNDGGHVQIFIVGRSSAGTLFALHTAGDFT
jgi:hypothetical protein